MMWQAFKQTFLSKVLFWEKTSFEAPILLGEWCLFEASGAISKTSACFFSLFWKPVSATGLDSDSELGPGPNPATNLWGNGVSLLSPSTQACLKGFFQGIEAARPSSPQGTMLQLGEKEIPVFFWYLREARRWMLWIPPYSDKPLLLQPSEEKSFLSPLFQAYEKLSEAFMDFPLLVWHRNAKQQIDFCNPLYVQLQGSSLASILGGQETFFASSQVASLFQKVQQGGLPETVTLSKRIDQTRHFFEVWEKPDPTTQGTWGIGFDVSEHEKQREALAQQLLIFKKTAEHLPQGIVFFDKTKRLVYANQAFQQLFRLTPDWIAREPSFEDLFDELRNQRLLPEVRDFSSYKKRFLNFFQEYHAKEEMLHLPDERSLKMHLLPQGRGELIFIFEDMTERLIFERKYNALLSVQNAFTQHLQEGILILGVDQRITLINDYCKRLWSEQPSALHEGEHISEFLNQKKTLFQSREGFEHFKKTLYTAMLQRTFQEGSCQQKEGICLKFKYIPLPNGEHFITYQDISDTLALSSTLEEAKHLLSTSWLLEQKMLLSLPLTDEKRAIDLGAMLTLLQKIFQPLIQQKKLTLHMPALHLYPFETTLPRENFFRFFYYLLGYILHACHRESQVFLSFQATSFPLRLRISYTQAPQEGSTPPVAFLLKAFAKNCPISLRIYDKKTKKRTVICDF
jgi:PAS domain-containing protein